MCILNKRQMGKKSNYASATVGIPLSANTLAKNYINEFDSWWRQYGSSIPHAILQRYSSGVTNNQIPCLEISSSFKDISSEQIRVLFVNCNPSGSDESYYMAHSQSVGINKVAGFNDFFYYDNQDSHYDACMRFVNELFKGDKHDFAMIDVFPLVKKDQSTIKQKWLIKNKSQDLINAFDRLRSLFKQIVFDIKPTVIIVSNAFASSLFEQGYLTDSIPTPSTTGAYYLNVEFNGYETVAFCGGMLTGQHTMDRFSRERLIRDVRDYLNIP